MTDSLLAILSGLAGGCFAALATRGQPVSTTLVALAMLFAFALGIQERAVRRAERATAAALGKALDGPQDRRGAVSAERTAR